ncbi:MAG TPA: D-glycerate dehydrogenase [Acidimicrobiia bacterium]
MKPQVLVTHRLPAGADAALDPSWKVWPGDGPMPRRELIAAVADVEGLLCMLVDAIDAELLAAAPNLRAISQMAVGVDNIDLAAATARGIPVGHTPGVLTETTADTAFALLAAATRRLSEGRDDLRAGHVGEWDPDYLLGGDLWRTRLGIVGMGRIGQAVARRGALGFEMEVIYTSRSPKDFSFPAERVPLDELLSRADHVVLATALTSETRHMIDATALARMRDGATLVNIARGGLIDHEALTEEARRGRLRIALDVTEPEPLPPDHPLLGLPNVLVIPHLGSASVSTRRAMAQMAIDNLEAALGGEQMPACANPEVYG